MSSPCRPPPSLLLPCMLALGLLNVACGEDPAGRPGPGQDLGPLLDGRNEDGAPAPDGGATPDGPRPDGAAPGLYPAVYGLTTLSPITPSVKARLRQIAGLASRDGQVFAKLGASMTVSKSFLHCFAGSNVVLDQYGGLNHTLGHFKHDLGGGVTPYDRTSICATVGWAALHAIKGSPSPAEQELAASSPRFAVVLYGTNDVGYDDIYGYADDMLDLTDLLIGKGVIPLLSSIPPRDDSATADLQVPRYNAVVRAVAQARQVPLIDLHRELVKLPGHGLGPDKVHPSADSAGACLLTAAGLQHGYNLRNLLTLQTLHRAKRVVLDDDPAPDPPGAARQGTGLIADPIVIDGLPFVDRRSTKGWSQRALDTYTGCKATQDESGPELLYRLVVAQQTKIRAYVFDRGTVDIDLHLLDASASAGGCIARDHQLITATLTPGTYHFALDTFVKGGQELAGEYLFVLLAE